MMKRPWPPRQARWGHRTAAFLRLETVSPPRFPVTWWSSRPRRRLRRQRPGCSGGMNGKNQTMVHPLSWPFRSAAGPPEEQLILYAQDLRRLLEVERGQRAIIQRVPRDGLRARGALETRTRHRPALIACAALRARARQGLDPACASDHIVEYGFLLHDIGKIGMPDTFSTSPASYRGRRGDPDTHTILGEELLSGVALRMARAGGRAPPSRALGRRGLSRRPAKKDIPFWARVFAVADELDAMTSDRPYRDARSWRGARGGDPPRARAPVRPARRRRLPRAHAAPAPDPL